MLIYLLSHVSLQFHYEFGFLGTVMDEQSHIRFDYSSKVGVIDKFIPS